MHLEEVVSGRGLKTEEVTQPTQPLAKPNEYLLNSSVNRYRPKK
jgi:hypothetical protein